ncbi:MAG: glutathione peroxidase [Myxococcota bacterium]
MPTLHDFSLSAIDGQERSLGDYAGKVVLCVNVASKCGLTPQYEGLQALYGRYRDRGFEILGFPCNQFMGQEPGSEAEIAEFCSTRYGVEFPMFSKIEVNGEGAHPLYRWLTAADAAPEGAGEVKWNFGKFLVDAEGRVVARFDPGTEPGSAELAGAIEKALA